MALGGGQFRVFGITPSTAESNSKYLKEKEIAGGGNDCCVCNKRTKHGTGRHER
jgi:hypothetical protein